MAFVVYPNLGYVLCLAKVASIKATRCNENSGDSHHGSRCQKGSSHNCQQIIDGKLEPLLRAYSLYSLFEDSYRHTQPSGWTISCASNKSNAEISCKLLREIIPISCGRGNNEMQRNTRTPIFYTAF
mmetsp:Transcript_24774/g.53437  ORF Transcript_24774/g.53437 Transcript_24774/m.53437 type:complete len:127 (+) Transcript_24774:420-800(+)